MEVIEIAMDTGYNSLTDKQVALIKFVQTHQSIIDIISAREKDGESKITVNEIAKAVDLSKNSTTKYLNRLKEAGCIEKISSGCYKVKHINLRKKGVFSVMIAIIDTLISQPELVSNYDEQAKALGVSWEEIKGAWGYLYMLFGSPYK
jgi:predicted transcriptional regulator of viral defense system